MREEDPKPVILGRVSGLFGVRGWVKIHSYTDPRAGILDYRDWLVSIGDGWKPVTVAEGRPHGKTLVARFEGVDDRDEAAALVDALIGIRREQLPAAEDGRYYWSDLEGLAVEDEGGNTLGRVAYLLETGANDVLVVQDEGREILVPFVTGNVIKDVDLAAGVIRVDWDWD